MVRDWFQGEGGWETERGEHVCVRESVRETVSGGVGRFPRSIPPRPPPSCLHPHPDRYTSPSVIGGPGTPYLSVLSADLVAT